MASIPTPDGAITRPVGVDFTAVMMLGSARGVDMVMLAEILPRIEGSIIDPPDAFERGGGNDDA